MNIATQVLRAEAHAEIGDLIQRDAGLLIERWLQRASEEQPNAQRVHRAAVLDHLPKFLSQLGNSLAEHGDNNGKKHRAQAAQHGLQRWQTGWSLTELVRDYQILRLVILEHLEQSIERSLTCRETMAVGLSLDDAIAASVAEFVANRDGHIRQVEQERAERQTLLEDAQRKWQHIFQHANWGLALANPAADIFLEVNPAFAHMHGYAVEELVGRATHIMFAPEDAAHYSESLRQSTELGDYVYESMHQRKDGTRFPVLTHVTVVKDSAGKVLFRASAFQDITDRKRLEESLRRQADALREADQRKNVFLATLAHELRNPLAPILNAVEVLHLLDPADAGIRNAREVVERQVKQLGRIVDDLLDISRIAQGKLQLRLARVDLAALVTQAIATSGPLIESRQHEFSVNLPTEPLWLEVDPARLVQVIANLLNNSAKYTNPGGKLWLRGERVDQEIVISVKDTGVGIEPEMLSRIFDLFTQVDGSPERAQGGLGIGLTLVRKLVDLHSGQVIAKSEGQGRGSEFIVRLPAHSVSTSQEVPLPTSYSPTAIKRRVLIVEDDLDNRQTMKVLLELLGHEVFDAEDGLGGVEQAKKHKPEVALIDIGLPGLNGLQVAQQIREALGSDVLLIALTGYGQEEDRRQALEAGFNAHLVKPVELDQLNQLLSGTGK
ncbi:MAG: ATP-binding protein [Gemmataceae bacterium]